MYTSNRKRGGNILKKTIQIILLILLTVALNLAILVNTVYVVEGISLTEILKLHSKGVYR